MVSRLATERGAIMNKIIGFSMCAALILALAAEAKRIDQGAKSKVEKRIDASQEIKPKRAPASVTPTKAREPVANRTSPLLYDTETPQWAQPRGNDNYSCEAATAFYGKTCTSRFLSF